MDHDQDHKCIHCRAHTQDDTHLWTCTNPSIAAARNSTTDELQMLILNKLQNSLPSIVKLGVPLGMIARNDTLFWDCDQQAVPEGLTIEEKHHLGINLHTLYRGDITAIIAYMHSKP